MQLNSNEYHIKQENLQHGKKRITLIPKVQVCDICEDQHKSRDMQIIKYPMVYEMGRVMMSKNICCECYPEVQEILKDNPYK